MSCPIHPQHQRDCVACLQLCIKGWEAAYKAVVGQFHHAVDERVDAELKLDCLRHERDELREKLESIGQYTPDQTEVWVRELPHLVVAFFQAKQAEWKALKELDEMKPKLAAHLERIEAVEAKRELLAKKLEALQGVLDCAVNYLGNETPWGTPKEEEVARQKMIDAAEAFHEAFD